MNVSFPEQFNMASYFLDHNIEEGRGDRVAVYYRDERYTYRQVYEMANRCGNALLSLGVEMEDRVLMVLPDSIEFVAAWHAVAKVGAVITMVNTIESKRLPVGESFQSAIAGPMKGPKSGIHPKANVSRNDRPNIHNIAPGMPERPCSTLPGICLGSALFKLFKTFFVIILLHLPSFSIPATGLSSMTTSSNSASSVSS